MAFEEENEARRDQAENMIDRARELTQQEKPRQAINLFLKVMHIFIDMGKYMLIPNIFDEVLKLAHTEMELLPLVDQIINIIQVVESRDLPEEEGLLKQRLANLYYNSNDYQNAANVYIETAELLFRANPEEYRQVSGMLLLRAAECFERIGRTERGERLILNAITRFEMSNFNYQHVEKEFQGFIAQKRFNSAVEKLDEIAIFFRRLQEELGKLEDINDTLKNLKNTVRARLTHILSEYNLLKMVCFRYMGDEDRVYHQAEESIRDLVEALQILKEAIIIGSYSKEDLSRLTYDLFMLQVFQEYADLQIEDPLDVATRGLPTNLVEKLTQMRFYAYTVQLLELNLTENTTFLGDLDMGAHLNQYRDFLIHSLKLKPKNH